MPPRGHSHSSHHSSHHSHHTSHSSHGSHIGGPRTRTVTKTRRVPRSMRPRTNQPANYNGLRSKHTYKCRKHDYIYYGSDWVDALSGCSNKKGYYTETGERFDTLILEDNGKLESTFECQFCGTVSKETWTSGAIPHCPNCGANFLETAGSTITDSIDNSYEVQKYQEEVVVNPNPLTYFIPLLLPFIYIVFILFVHFKDNSAAKTKYDSNLSLFGDTIHVDSINRDLHWMSEYESYYDPVSDCYVWYNTEVEPAVWQYWYEDISSHYGDYGWMEYELYEDQWYIETSNNHWERLPDNYNPENLWHITGELSGTSYTTDYNVEYFGLFVCIDEGDLSYWVDDMNAFYVMDYDCYVRVNFDADPHTIQYWYDGASSPYESAGGGWLEYDYDEDTWYVEESPGNWTTLPARYSDECRWHVRSEIVGNGVFLVEEN